MEKREKLWLVSTIQKTGVVMSAFAIAIIFGAVSAFAAEPGPTLSANGFMHLDMDEPKPTG